MTDKQRAALAANIVNSLVADMFITFPNIREAVDILAVGSWGEFLDARYELTDEMLVDVIRATSPAEPALPEEPPLREFD